MVSVNPGCVKVTQLQDSVVYEFLSVYEPT